MRLIIFGLLFISSRALASDCYDNLPPLPNNYVTTQFSNGWYVEDADSVIVNYTAQILAEGYPIGHLLANCKNQTLAQSSDDLIAKMRQAAQANDKNVTSASHAGLDVATGLGAGAAAP